MMKGIITKEFWEKYWTLLVEGKENHIAPVLFCALCGKEINLKAIREYNENKQKAFNPQKDINQGCCECTLWQVGGEDGK